MTFPIKTSFYHLPYEIKNRRKKESKSEKAIHLIFDPYEVVKRLDDGRRESSLRHGDY